MSDSFFWQEGADVSDVKSAKLESMLKNGFVGKNDLPAEQWPLWFPHIGGDKFSLPQPNLQNWGLAFKSGISPKD